MALTIDLDQEATYWTLKLAGDLDYGECATFRMNIDRILKNAPPATIVDLSDVEYLDSSGLGLLLSLSKEYGPQSIRFNTVSPGPVATDLWLGTDGFAATIAKATGTDVDSARDAAIAAQGGFSTGRFTTPQEVADLVLVLASGRAGNVTGSDFMIDGGLVKGL